MAVKMTGLGYPNLIDCNGGGGVVLYPISYIEGMNLQYRDSNTIRILYGKCRDKDNTENMEITYGNYLTLDIRNNGANGLDTGSELSNRWYYIWVIKNIISGVVAGLFSLSSVSPTMPSGYTKKRFIGTIRNNGSRNILPFIQIGKYNNKIYEWNLDREHELFILQDGNATIWTGVDITALTPPNARMCHLNGFAHHVASGYAYMRSEAVPNCISGQVVLKIEESSENFDIIVDGYKYVYYVTSNCRLNMSIIGYTEEV